MHRITQFYGTASLVNQVHGRRTRGVHHRPGWQFIRVYVSVHVVIMSLVSDALICLAARSPFSLFVVCLYVCTLASSIAHVFMVRDGWSGVLIL